MEIIKWNIEILHFSKTLLNYNGIKYASSLCRVLSTLCLNTGFFNKIDLWNMLLAATESEKLFLVEE